jgi:hypothetical protein
MDGMWQPSSFVFTKSPSIIHKNYFVKSLVYFTMQARLIFFFNVKNNI